MKDGSLLGGEACGSDGGKKRSLVKSSGHYKELTAILTSSENPTHALLVTGEIRGVL
jgi:hypothetical protein